MGSDLPFDVIMIVVIPIGLHRYREVDCRTWRHWGDLESQLFGFHIHTCIRIRDCSADGDSFQSSTMDSTMKIAAVAIAGPLLIAKTILHVLA